MLPAVTLSSLEMLWTTQSIRLLMCITLQESSVEQIMSHVCRLPIGIIWDLWGALIFSKVAEAEAVLLKALLWINGLLLLLFIKVPSVKDKRGCERGQHPKSRCSVLRRTDYPLRIIFGHIQPTCMVVLDNENCDQVTCPKKRNWCQPIFGEPLSQVWPR